MMGDELSLINRISRLVIEPVGRYSSAFEHEEGFCLTHDQVEEFQVKYCGKLIANFWVSNTMKDSIYMRVPVDIEILDYILKQMEIRKFPNKNA